MEEVEREQAVRIKGQKVFHYEHEMFSMKLKDHRQGNRRYT